MGDKSSITKVVPAKKVAPVVSNPVVKKESKKTYWIIGGIIVIILAILVIFATIGGAFSSEEKSVKDNLYSSMLMSCNNDPKSSEIDCETISRCAADGMVGLLTDDEVSRLSELMESDNWNMDSSSDFFSSNLDKDRLLLMGDVILECMGIDSA